MARNFQVICCLAVICNLATLVYAAEYNDSYELVQLHNELTLLADLADTIASENATKAAQRLGLASFPEVLVGVVKNFDPQILSQSPAPSLAPAHRISSKTIEEFGAKHGMKEMRLVGVSDPGDLYFMSKQEPHYLFIIHKDKGVSNVEKLTLDGWAIEENYKEHGWSHGASESYGYIPLTRVNDKKEFELAVFDTRNKAINNIGIVPEKFSIYALNQHAAILAKQIYDPSLQNVFYFKSGEYEHILSKNAGKSFIFSAMLDNTNRVLWHGHKLHFSDARNPELTIMLPDSVYFYFYYFATNDAGSIISTVHEIKNPKSSEKQYALSQWLCTKDYSRKRFTYDWWRKLGVQINKDNNVAVGTISYKKRYVTYHGRYPWGVKNLDKGPRVVILETGKVLQDDLSEIKAYNEIDVMMASQNARWIVVQDEEGSVYTWELRGINLGKTCTVADRLALAEFRQFYELGTERNEKTRRDRVIRLNQQQWNTYQALLGRPECEVPREWSRLFRPIK